MNRRTIPGMWQSGLASRPPDAVAYLVRSGSSWSEVTWGEAASRVEAMANGLLARGVGKGEVIAVLAPTTLEWTLFDFALASVGGVTAPVYFTSSPEDAQYVVRHAGAIGILCDTDEQLAKVDGMSQLRKELTLTYADLERLEEEGRAFSHANPHALESVSAAIADDDLYTFIYTSGTTGPPKGCMILHRNYYEMAAVVEKMPEMLHAGDLALLYLPMAHNFGRLVSLGGAKIGYTIAFEPNPYAVADALPAVRPTFFPSVPRVFEKIHTNVAAAFDEATGPKRKLIDWSLRIGYDVAARRQAGLPIPRSLARRHRLADRLVYSKVKARLGGRLRLGVSGAAPLAQSILEFFAALDIPIVEAYGLTECTSGATANRPIAYRHGTVGRALPGFELRLAEDGELELRSETVFAGYYKDPEATAAVLSEDGWLRTGDIASIDEEGFVTITDRKKDILVTAGGKNVAPQNLEVALKTSRFVSQAIVVGDRRPYIAALITLDPVEVASWAKEQGLTEDVTTLSTSPQAQTLIQGVVDEVNAGRSRFEQIKRFAILPRDFEMAREELTPTLKLRRKVVLGHFADEVDRLYAE
ncbi:MAG: AMP-dependent synthetase/ligase [Gaiella sp.]